MSHSNEADDDVHSINNIGRRTSVLERKTSDSFLVEQAKKYQINSSIAFGSSILVTGHAGLPGINQV